MNLTIIRSQLESFELELSREHLQHLVGIKEELNSAPIYNKYPELFSLKNVKDVRKIVDGSSGLERRRNLYLLGALINSYLSEPLKELSDKRDTFEAKATVKVGKKDVAFRQIGVLISNTKSHAERKRLFALSLPVKEKIMEFDKTMLEKEWELAAKTGFPDYTAAYSFVKECDYERMADEMRRFLADTDILYERLIKEAMESIEVPLKNAEGFDISFWIRNPSFDPYFIKENLVGSLKQTLNGFGFELDKQKNIELDVEDRPQKVPRAFCMPLRVPEEVHLVIKPSGGQNDFKSLYHEAGHSEHYANSSADLPFEFKHLGSHCVSETYAFTFEHIIMTREWLKRQTEMDENTVSDFLRFDMTVKLFFLRRYATKLLYELKLHRGDLARVDGAFSPTKGKPYKNMAECYADMLSKAAKVKIHAINWASDVDGGYYSADYLRAWILEAQLKSYLKKTFGENWIENKKAGAFLQSLWKDGNQPSPIELSKQFGFKEISVDILTHEIMEFFKSAGYRKQPSC